jgi:hypothetical protein
MAREMLFNLCLSRQTPGQTTTVIVVGGQTFKAG